VTEWFQGFLVNDYNLNVLLCSLAHCFYCAMYAVWNS